MKASEEVKADMKAREGFRAKAYMDVDAFACGFGHRKGVTQSTICDRAQADKWFEEDVEDAENVIRKWVRVPLSQGQWDALVSFIFNFGEPKFKTSTLLKKINLGDFDGAAKEFLKWNKMKNKDKVLVVSDNLDARRKAEARMFGIKPEDLKKAGSVGVAVATTGLSSYLIGAGVAAALFLS